MTQDSAPTLDDLNRITAPAWLWDGQRLRMVWANRAGVAFFGCTSLFDLIDMPFDDADPGVARVRELAGKVKRGESWQEVMSFASAMSNEPLSVNLHVHALADGRNGLLLVAEAENARQGGAHSQQALQASVLESLPVATLICTASGSVHVANAAARDIWRGQVPTSVAEMAGDKVAGSLLERSLRAGVAGTSAIIATGFGKREFRLLARRLGEADAPDGFSLVLEDITDRRALEHHATRPQGRAGIAGTAAGNAAPITTTKPVISQPHKASGMSNGLEGLRAAIEAAGLNTENEAAGLNTNSEAAKGDAQSHTRSAAAAPFQVPPAEIPPASSNSSAASAPHAMAAARFDVSPVVRKALSGVKRAVVLYRGSKLVYANQAAATLLGHDSDDATAGRNDIAAAINAVEGKSGTVELDTVTTGPITVLLEKSTFPWNDGAMPLAVLSQIEASSVQKADYPVAIEPVEAGVPTGPEAESSPETEQPETAGPVPKPQQDNEPSDAATDVPEAVHAAGPDHADNEQAGYAAASASSTITTITTTGTAAGPMASAPVDVNGLFSILDTASDGVVFLSEAGDITFMSAGAEALFGVHAASVIDTPLAALMDKGSAKTVRDYVAALGERGLSSLFNSGCEVTARMQDGGEVPLFLAMRRMDDSIAGIPPSAYCAVLRDITQWKKTEAELREAKDRAEQSSKQKSEFLARMSHELRTPLNAILGFSDVMRKGEFGKLGNERYEGYANDIHTSGEYLLSLVNDLLDLSRVEAGKLELNFTSVDLGAIIDTCIKLMQNEATGARVVLRKTIAANLPQVVADQRSVKQVVLNLISNAIKFTDPGGQVIISARMIGTGELVLSVSDTGVGMNEQQLDEALRPFSRIETTGREVQGTGLGLPLTKALVEANRARFTISSEPRKGTRVDITFPTTRVLAS